MREHDITYIYADEMPKLEALLRQSVAGRSWVSTSIHKGRERWKFCRFSSPKPKIKIAYAGKE